ncbi:phage portal protein [Burkholderia sp. TSV86]|uniref:phage portal protein n=1 Tax=Burkholderia sp. TSV86 TaxID=1385594 RepID=UPI00075C65EF|nr:phage portal protein [Burkholderia sp. TSV86]KVE35258.1 portal protein [Burkholderia sp. TSV86]
MFKASYTDPNDRWGATPVSPDVFISLRQPALVARSREQWSNNDYVRGFIRKVRQNVVGHHGIILQSKATLANGKLDKNANDAIESAWAEWGKKGHCDVTGKLSWRELQCLAAEHAARDGEFICRIVRGADAGPFGFALQVLDPQRLSVRYDNFNYGDNGHFIRQGIEFDRYGKPVAYHFTSTDEWDSYYYSISGKGFARVPANEVIHGFVTEMAGQRRGIPWTATGLFRLHHLQGFEDAAVQNARASATKMGFIQYEEGFGPEYDEKVDTAATIDAEPLGFFELPEGARIAEWSPQYPTGELAVFNKAMLRSAATGLGVAYNSLANDLEGVNFSSIRDGKMDERESWKEIQQWLIDTLCEPVFHEWLKIALLSESITNLYGNPLPASRIANYRQVHWQPKRWPWVDPKADATAKVTEIRAGLTSPSQVIREQGRDPDTVFEEIRNDYERMKAIGIPDTIINIFFGVAPAPEPSPSKGDVSQGKEPKL